MFKGIQSLDNGAFAPNGIGRKVNRKATGPVLQKGLRIFLIWCLVCIYPLYRILPIWTAWENNILENSQAVVLFIGFLMALYFAYVDRNNKWTKFWLAMAPFWLIIFGRELNWGRVFLPPTSKSILHGVEFPPLKALWYAPVVKPLIGLCLIWGFYLFFRYRGYQMLLQLFHQKHFPVFEMAVAIITIAFSPIAEKDYLYILGVRCELMEEILELISYMGLIISQVDIFIETRSERNN